MLAGESSRAHGALLESTRPQPARLWGDYLLDWGALARGALCLWVRFW